MWVMVSLDNRARSIRNDRIRQNDDEDDGDDDDEDFVMVDVLVGSFFPFVSSSRVVIVVVYE